MNEPFISYLVEHENTESFIRLLFQTESPSLWKRAKKEVFVVIQKYDTIYYKVKNGKEDDPWVLLILMGIHREIEKKQGRDSVCIRKHNTIDEEWKFLKQSGEKRKQEEQEQKQQTVSLLLSLLEKRKQQILQDSLEKRLKSFEEGLKDILF